MRSSSDNPKITGISGTFFRKQKICVFGSTSLSPFLPHDLYKCETGLLKQPKLT